MAKQKLVTKNDEGTYDFRCPYTSGCGKDGIPFSSTGWGKKDDAAERGKQHLADHEGTPMPELKEFWKARSLTNETAGQVNKDDWEL